MQIKGALAMFILIIFFVTCDSSTAPDTSELQITIRGMVTDSETGAPITGADVEAYERIWYPIFVAGTSTDDGGRYRLTFPLKKVECEQEHYWLKASHYLYMPSNTLGSHGVRCITDEQLYDFQLDPVHFSQ